MAKYCAYCGSQINDEAVFCTNCGKPVLKAQQKNPAQAPVRQAAHPPVRQPSQPGYNAGWQVKAPQLAPHPQAQPKKKKGGAGVLAALLAVLLLAGVLCFIWPGFLRKKEADPASLVNRVQVTVPNPTGPEALVNLEGALALQYYIEARMYLEKLSTYDAGKLDGEEFKKLVDNTVTAFENAEKISDSLSKAVDFWMEADDVRDKPKIKVLQTAGTNKAGSLGDLFSVKAYAAEKSASELTAQEIVDAFDKAHNGQKIKTVAELLGTDAKHAYAQLKIAQATLEGIEANKIAEQATTCIRVAKTLKTAGTVAGLVVAAAPVATGAVATMATGELIATGGGIVMGAVNSGIEIVSTGATLYYGTDENRLTMKADEIADSKAMKTANLVVGLAGFGYNIKNIVTKANEMLDNASTMDDLHELFTSLSQNAGKEGTDLFGILSFGLGNLDPEEGTLMGIKMEPGANGLKISLSDTKTGTSESQKEAMKQVLQDAGYTSREAEKAVENAAEMMESGKKSSETADPGADLPADFVDSRLAANEAIAPGSPFIDLDEYIEQMEALMEELAKYEMPETTAAATGAEETQPASTGAPETKAPETTAAGPSLSGLGWIDPYEYFKVDDVFKLYPLLSQYKPAAMKVRPVAYASYGPIKVSNTDSFVIDLTAGATTLYETSYYEGSSIESAYSRHDFTLTFTGKPDSYSLFTVGMARAEYRTEDGSLRGSEAVEKATIMNSEGWSSFINDKKAFGVTEMSYKFLFVIEEVLFP